MDEMVMLASALTRGCRRPMVVVDLPFGSYQAADAEAVPAPVAARITQALSIPTIGIGAGAGCDGQVLVWHDMLGLYEGKSPRFVKQCAELAPPIRDAIARYAAEVRDGAFPEGKHTYAMADDELALFEDALAEIREPAGR
jgi:ketopantoate hydroxymethyltransferase